MYETSSCIFVILMGVAGAIFHLFILYHYIPENSRPSFLSNGISWLSVVLFIGGGGVITLILSLPTPVEGELIRASFITPWHIFVKGLTYPGFILGMVLARQVQRMVPTNRTTNGVVERTIREDRL